jgi:hypothetical protein
VSGWREGRCPADEKKEGKSGYLDKNPLLFHKKALYYVPFAKEFAAAKKSQKSSQK